jgi:phosphoserine phosphatase
VDNGFASARLVRVPTDELKAVAIRQRIGEPIDLALGNSVHDQAMLEMAKYPVCVNPTPDLEEIARHRSWPVYWPAGTKLQPEATI